MAKINVFEGIGLLKKKIFKDPGLPEARAKKLKELDEWGIRHYNKTIPEDYLYIEAWNQDFAIYGAMLKKSHRLKLDKEEQEHLNIGKARLLIDNKSKAYKELINNCDTVECLETIIFEDL